MSAYTVIVGVSVLYISCLSLSHLCSSGSIVCQLPSYQRGCSCPNCAANFHPKSADFRQSKQAQGLLLLEVYWSHGKPPRGGQDFKISPCNVVIFGFKSPSAWPVGLPTKLRGVGHCSTCQKSKVWQGKNPTGTWLEVGFCLVTLVKYMQITEIDCWREKTIVLMLSLSATHTGWLPECHDMSRAQRTLLSVSPKGWSPGNPGVVFGDLGIFYRFQVTSTED